MQLQGSLAAYEAAGIAVMAISPDRVADLAAFASEHGITFPLLSDADASVIRAYGILNTLIDEDEEEYGIPYPGSYLVGRDGRVERKSFEREYQRRETALTTLRTGFGVDPDDVGASAEAIGAPSGSVARPGVRVRATLGALHLGFMDHADLYVTLELDDDLHVYGRPIPDGYRAVDVRVGAPDAVQVGETVWPPTRPMRLAGLDEVFAVFEERATIRVPLVLVERPSEELSEVRLRVAVAYQACTDRMCFAPDRVELELAVPLRA